MGLTIQKLFLNSHIKIGYFENNDADLKFYDEVYGSLIKQVDTTMDLIFTKYLKGLIYYKGTHRIEQYPVDRDGVKSHPGKRPTYDIDDDSVMVCYEACEKYVNLLKGDENVTQDVTQDVTQNVTQGAIKDKTDIKIINMIKNDNKITIDKIAQDLKLSRRTIIRHIKSINRLKYVGSGYSGHWKIIK